VIMAGGLRRPGTLGGSRWQGPGAGPPAGGSRPDACGGPGTRSAETGCGVAGEELDQKLI